MKSSKRYGVVLFCIILIIIVGAIVLKINKKDNIILKVNEEPLYESEYILAKENYGHMSDEEIMNELILEILTLQKATEMKISITDGKVSDTIEELKNLIISDYVSSIEIDSSKIDIKVKEYIKSKEIEDISSEDYELIEESFLEQEKDILGEKYFKSWRENLIISSDIEFFGDYKEVLYQISDEAIYPTRKITFDELIRDYGENINYESKQLKEEFKIEYIKVNEIDSNSNESIFVNYVKYNDEKKFFVFIATVINDDMNLSDMLHSGDKTVLIGADKGNMKVLHSEASENNDRMSINMTWYNEDHNRAYQIFSEYITEDQIISIANELIGK